MPGYVAASRSVPGSLQAVGSNFPLPLPLPLLTPPSPRWAMEGDLIWPRVLQPRANLTAAQSHELAFSVHQVSRLPRHTLLLAPIALKKCFLCLRTPVSYVSCPYSEAKQNTSSADARPGMLACALEHAAWIPAQGRDDSRFSQPAKNNFPLKSASARIPPPPPPHPRTT